MDRNLKLIIGIALILLALLLITTGVNAQETNDLGTAPIDSQIIYSYNSSKYSYVGVASTDLPSSIIGNETTISVVDSTGDTKSLSIDAQIPTQDRINETELLDTTYYLELEIENTSNYFVAYSYDINTSRELTIEDLETKLVEKNQTISNLTTLLDEKNQTIADLESDIVTLESRINNLTAALNDNLTRVEDLETRVDELSAKNTYLREVHNETKTSYEQTLDAKESQIDSLEDQISVLSSELNETEDELSDAESLISSKDTTIGELNQTVRSLNSQLDTKSEQVDVLKDEVSEYETKVNNLSTELKIKEDKLENNTLIPIKGGQLLWVAVLFMVFAVLGVYGVSVRGSSESYGSNHRVSDRNFQQNTSGGLSDSELDKLEKGECPNCDGAAYNVQIDPENDEISWDCDNCDN